MQMHASVGNFYRRGNVPFLLCKVGQKNLVVLIGLFTGYPWNNPVEVADTHNINGVEWEQITRDRPESPSEYKFEQIFCTFQLKVEKGFLLLVAKRDALTEVERGSPRFCFGMVLALLTSDC